MNKYKVYFNRKDNIKEVLNERIKDSLCHIIWLNKELSDNFNGNGAGCLLFVSGFIFHMLVFS